MYPGFDDTNREYMSFFRVSSEGRAACPAEEQRFFTGCIDEDSASYRAVSLYGETIDKVNDRMAVKPGHIARTTREHSHLHFFACVWFQPP